jgi:hypothetical protein
VLLGSVLANRLEGSWKAAGHIGRGCRRCRGEKTRIMECLEVDRESVQVMPRKKARITEACLRVC